jgi:hypothetical protein
MIDKMMNCTAPGSQDLTNTIYGDYMDGIESIIGNEGTDFNGPDSFEW